MPHVPKGIIVGHDTVIGANCRIFQHVTIAHGNVIICNNVKIGANAVVVENVPDNATVVLPKSRIIIK